MTQVVQRGGSFDFDLPNYEKKQLFLFALLINYFSELCLDKHHAVLNKVSQRPTLQLPKQLLSKMWYIEQFTEHTKQISFLNNRNVHRDEIRCEGHPTFNYQ